MCFADSREETVLGSIPLPSYVISPVEPEDHINRKYAFKVTKKQTNSTILWSIYKQSQSMHYQ